MTLVQEYRPSTRGFMMRAGIFLLLAVGVVVFARGEQAFSAKLLPVTLVAAVLMVILVYWRRKSGTPAIRLYEEGIEGAEGFTAWKDVSGLGLVNMGMDTRVMGLRIDRVNGDTIRESLDDLDSSPQEILQRANALRQRA